MGLFDYSDAMRALDQQGTPQPKARRYIYKAGTKMLSPLFRDYALTYTTANPMVADENGDFPECYLLAGDYRVRIEDRMGETIMDVDGVTVVQPTIGGGGGSSTPATFSAALVDSFGSTAMMLADAQMTYAAGDDQVLAGTMFRLRTKDFAYEIADAAASDWHLQTAGGIKLYALPDKTGDVFTSQLGWPTGTPATADLQRFLAGRQTGIKGLRQDQDLILAGPIAIPATLTNGWRSDDYDVLSHGAFATRSILLQNLTDPRATANAIAKSSFVTSAPDGFGFGGLRFDNDAPIDVSSLTNGGNGEAVLDLTAVDAPWIDKCRADFATGKVLKLHYCGNWRFVDTQYGPQQFCVYLSGRSDYGVMRGCRGETGYQDASNIHGDVVKTAASDNQGPRYCTISDNLLVSTHRDALDFTGGAFGWTINANYMRAAVAALDLKQLSNTVGDDQKQVAWFKGLTVTGNTFEGGGVILTHLINISNFGRMPNSDRAPREITFANNIHIPTASGKAGYIANGVGNFTVDGDVFTALEGVSAGDFDASVETEFPANRLIGQPFHITGTGTVQGLALTAGTYLWPHRDNASPTDPADWRVSSSLWLSTTPLDLDTVTLSGATYRGDLDATQGLPGGTGAVAAGDYWTVRTPGNVVPNVYVHNWDRLIAKHDIPDASLSNYDEDWLLLEGNITPIPTDINFSNIRWDGRGDGRMTLNAGRRIFVHFDEAILARQKAITVGSRNVELSGKAKILRDELNPTQDITPIRVQGGAGVYFDLSLENMSSVGGDVAIEVTGVCEEIFLDGQYTGIGRVVVVANGSTVQKAHIGTRSGLTARGTWEVIGGNGAIDWANVGRVNLDRSNINFGQPNTPGLHTLRRGAGATLVVGNGVIRATNEFHFIDTEAAAATDILTDIWGGDVGDTVTLTIVDGARTVTANSTGNLVLPSDRVLNTPSATLVVRRHADGNWHEVSFTDTV